MGSSEPPYWMLGIPVALLLLYVMVSVVARVARRTPVERPRLWSHGRPAPDGEPWASIRGSARVGGMASSMPLGRLDVFEEALVIRLAPFLPALPVGRDDVDVLRIKHWGLFPELRFYRADGTDLGVRFGAPNEDAIVDALRAGRWLDLLEGPRRS